MVGERPQLIEIFIDVLMSEKYIRLASRADLVATKTRDPSCLSYAQVRPPKGLIGSTHELI